MFFPPLLSGLPCSSKVTTNRDEKVYANAPSFSNCFGDTNFKYPVPGPEKTVTHHGVGLPTCKALTVSQRHPGGMIQSVVWSPDNAPDAFPTPDLIATLGWLYNWQSNKTLFLLHKASSISLPEAPYTADLLIKESDPLLAVGTSRGRDFSIFFDGIHEPAFLLAGSSFKGRIWSQHMLQQASCKLATICIKFWLFTAHPWAGYQVVEGYQLSAKPEVKATLSSSPYLWLLITFQSSDYRKKVSSTRC